MLNDENVSNADAYKRMTEIEDNMELGEKIAIWFRDEDILAVGTEENT